MYKDTMMLGKKQKSKQTRKHLSKRKRFSVLWNPYMKWSRGIGVEGYINNLIFSLGLIQMLDVHPLLD